MFPKQQLDSQRVDSPTREALRQKVLRAHFAALQCKSSYLPSPLLPDPGDYGWKQDSTNSLQEAVTTTLSPAPETKIHVTVVNSHSCKCRKTGSNCYELYRCDGCQNNEKDKFVKAVHKDIEEGFDY